MGERRGSNPQPPGPQPSALPLSYAHHIASIIIESVATLKK